MSTQNTQESKVITKVGDYHGIVTLFSIILTGNRPVIFTRINRIQPVEGQPDRDFDITNEHTTHAVRLHDPEALRIGLGELKTAFPNDLAVLTDRECLIKLAKEPRLLVGRRVGFAIQHQMKAGIPQKNKDTGEHYFNVRLRAVEAMTDTTATTLIDSLLTHIPKEADPFAS